MNVFAWGGAAGAATVFSVASSIAFADLNDTEQRWEVLSYELRAQRALSIAADDLYEPDLNETERRWILVRDELVRDASARADEHHDEARTIVIETAQLDKALLTAARHGYSDVAVALLEGGADPDAMDAHGLTPLVLSAIYGYEHITHALIQSGAHVNLRTQEGNTALHSASRYGHEGVVKALLCAGADISIKNKKGNTALVRASTYGHGDVVRLLLDLGSTTHVSR